MALGHAIGQQLAGLIHAPTPGPFGLGGQQSDLGPVGPNARLGWAPAQALVPRQFNQGPTPYQIHPQGIQALLAALAAHFSGSPLGLQAPYYRSQG